MRFEGKTALVTGGNSGIGRGIVHRLIAEGASVAFAGRDAAKGSAVEQEVKEMGGTAQFFRCDLAHEDAVGRMIEAVTEIFGGLNIVVNNAGLGSRRAGISPEDPPGARWEKMRGPNLDSAYFVSSSALPWLKRAGDGSIVNISSTATLHGNWGLYCVAKAAVEALTRSLAAEGAPHGIRANCISPGWIGTAEDGKQHASGSKSGEWDLPPSLLGRMGTPSEIAAAVVFLAGPEASFITGQTLIVDGGLSIIDYTSLPLLKEKGAVLFSGAVDAQRS